MSEKPQIRMFSTTWCPDCHATKAVLKSRGMEFIEIDIEQDSEAAEYVMSVNGGKRSVPTLEFAGKAASMSGFSRQKLDTWLTEVGLK